MNSFDDTLWERLADRGADNADVAPERTHRHGVALTAGATCALAAAATAAVLLISGSTATTPAYALTPHSDGTYTLTLNSLSNDIPQLNATLASMNIDETVVPVTSSCTFVFGINDVGSGEKTMTLYPNHDDLAPGYQGVLAAEQLPNGQIALTQGAMLPAKIPACFATLAYTDSHTPPVGSNAGNSGGGNSGNTSTS